MNFQKAISNNIEARGYYEGHEPVPLLARHVAKLAEELGELGDEIVMSWFKKSAISGFQSSLSVLGKRAGNVFDNANWEGAGFANEWDSPEQLKKELADCQVVIMSMAQIISDNFGEFDVLQAALDKSTADIKRGVR